VKNKTMNEKHIVFLNPFFTVRVENPFKGLYDEWSLASGHK
jgi:hypothetical protein